jgi:hypothetical protein
VRANVTAEEDEETLLEMLVASSMMEGGRMESDRDSEVILPTLWNAAKGVAKAGVKVLKGVVKGGLKVVKHVVGGGKRALKRAGRRMLRRGKSLRSKCRGSRRGKSLRKCIRRHAGRRRRAMRLRRRKLLLQEIACLKDGSSSRKCNVKKIKKHVPNIAKKIGRVCCAAYYALRLHVVEYVPRRVRSTYLCYRNN